MDKKPEHCADVKATLLAVLVVAVALIAGHLLMDFDNAYSELLRMMYCDGGPDIRGGKTAAVGFSLYFPALGAGMLFARFRGRLPIPRLRLVLVSFTVNVLIYHLNFLYPHLVTFDMWWLRHITALGYLIGMPFNVLVMTVAFYIGAHSIEQMMLKRL